LLIRPYRVRGRPHYYSTKKEEYAHIKFDLDAIKHRKANACGLTAIELAELEKAEEIRRGKARAATSEDIEEDEDEQGFLAPDLPPLARAGEF